MKQNMNLSFARAVFMRTVQLFGATLFRVVFRVRAGKTLGVSTTWSRGTKTFLKLSMHSHHASLCGSPGKAASRRSPRFSTGTVGQLDESTVLTYIIHAAHTLY